ncbi:hypothetical protein [Ferrimonas lipolytica]|uniref:Uncharacterized protein n=1 Tax=Ferrimonas lipolytica TaxID=2724191 RepID=A0A6H1UB26_9GAMM|nr:hypothetical protein [Ferrimonas lipolytica]QIZ76038.1 hypothetical protein HER31_03530 [Ferrimonas lipolytica]
MKVFGLAVLLIGLSGCGEPQLVWVHDDKANHNFLQDRDTCSTRIGSMDADYKQMFDRCMTELGWKQQQLN